MIRLPEVPGQRGGNCYVYPVIVLFPIILIFIGLPLKAVIAVQKRLCRRNSKWVGLILPAAALVYGLFLTAVLSVAMLHYDGPPMITEMSYTPPAGAPSSYEPSPDEVTVTYFPDPEHPLTPGMVAGFLFVFNIPTLSLGWIWLKSRREEQVKAEMDKMRAQELE